MQHKSLILSLSFATLAAASAAALQDFQSESTNDAQRAQVFQKATFAAGNHTQWPCNRMAWAGRKAGRRAAHAAFLEDLTKAVNVSDPFDQWDAVVEAFEAHDEEVELVDDQFDARIDLCIELGNAGTYEPEIDPDDFTADINHPMLGWTLGSTWVYEAETEDGDELIHVTPLEETREINGVVCRAVQDIVWLEVDSDGDGDDDEYVVIEDTIDYFAQDSAGNVWYFGEISTNYEDGFVTDLDGSWFAGENDAHAGIIMQAVPEVGVPYRQEFLPFEAEDIGTVVDLNGEADVEYGFFEHCLVIQDSTPIDPEADEHKFFAAGVGMVMEVDQESGETLQLVDIIPAD